MNKTIEPLIKFNTHEDGHNEILIYGIIGDSYWDDVNSKAFFDQMKALEGADVTVRINSYGGSVIAGTAIHTMLAIHTGKVTAQIDGYAMSMASVIAMAADEITISEIGAFMIHSPWSVVAGNADEIRKEAAVLDGMESALVNAYHAKTGIDKAELSEMLKAETWIYADQAVEQGFANRTIKPIKADACFDQSIEKKLTNMPKAMAQFIALHEDSEGLADDNINTDENTSETETETINSDENDTSTTHNKTDNAPKGKSTNPETDPVKAERTRTKSIMAACRSAGLLHLAENYIEKDYTLVMVKDLLLEIKAGQEEHPLGAHYTTPPPENNTSASVWEAGYKAAGVKTKAN